MEALKKLGFKDHRKEAATNGKKPEKTFFIVGKDEVAGSNPAISSTTPRHVVSMGPGVFYACF